MKDALSLSHQPYNQEQNLKKKMQKENDKKKKIGVTSVGRPFSFFFFFLPFFLSP